MGRRGSTYGAQPHRTIYGAERLHLWGSAPQDEEEDGEHRGETPNVWGRAVGRGGIPRQGVTKWGPAALRGRPTDSAPQPHGGLAPLGGSAATENPWSSNGICGAEGGQTHRNT